MHINFFLNICTILPGLQTIFRAELMAIYKTLKILTTRFIDEPAYIFTDCINCLYVLQTHLTHVSFRAHRIHSEGLIAGDEFLHLDYNIFFRLNMVPFLLSNPTTNPTKK